MLVHCLKVVALPSVPLAVQSHENLTTIFDDDKTNSPSQVERTSSLNQYHAELQIALLGPLGSVGQAPLRIQGLPRRQSRSSLLGVVYRMDDLLKG
jgi:hypothetical protein